MRNELPKFFGQILNVNDSWEIVKIEAYAYFNLSLINNLIFKQRKGTKK